MRQGNYWVRNGCHFVGEFTSRGKVVAALMRPGKQRRELAGTFAELLLVPQHSELPLGSVGVILKGHGESSKNAEDIAIRIGQRVWSFPLDIIGKESQYDESSAYLEKYPAFVQPEPLTLSARVTEHFSQPVLVASGPSATLELLRATNLYENNRGIVVQLGLRHEDYTIGFMQSYISGTQDFGLVKQSSIDEALLFWRNMMA